MKRNILKITALLLILTGIFACKKEKENDDNNTTLPPLEGTKWKLSGIVDVQTGTMKELEPKDCKECYLLMFNTDTTGHGYSTSNEIIFNISRIPVKVIMTEVVEGGDGNLFVHSFCSTISYIYEDNNLKFFYEKDKKKSYLLFKLIES